MVQANGWNSLHPLVHAPAGIVVPVAACTNEFNTVISLVLEIHISQ